MPWYEAQRFRRTQDGFYYPDESILDGSYYVDDNEESYVDYWAARADMDEDTEIDNFNLCIAMLDDAAKLAKSLDYNEVSQAAYLVETVFDLLQKITIYPTHHLRLRAIKIEDEIFKQ
jgi:hypothetical protein